MNSATGRVFLASGLQGAIAAARESELRRAVRNPSLLPDVAPTRAGLDDLAGATRRRGFASVDGRYIPGLVAVAAPVPDWQGEAQAEITRVGTDPTAIGPASAQVRFLFEFCAERAVAQRD